MRHAISRNAIPLAAALLLATTGALAQQGPLETFPPPWETTPLQAHEVPRVYVNEWRKASNRKHCALLVLKDANREKGLRMRRANFAGGWAVAYDAPGQRSAFGIAGTGITPGPGSYTFPNNIQWSDGSSVSYGLEGGTGPGHLAYLTVAGEHCLYNIWSKRGQAHLEHLFSTLRKVE